MTLTRLDFIAILFGDGWNAAQWEATNDEITFTWLPEYLNNAKH